MNLNTVEVKYADKVATLIMKRSKALNAVNMELAEDLTTAMKEIEGRDDISVVIVRGEGRAFCAGADLKEMSAGLTKEQHFEKLINLQDVGRIMRESDKIFIGAVQGYAVGIGFEIALACDQVIASEDAIFRFPEVEIDATVTGGGHKLLLEAVGNMLKAKELLFRGTKVPGAKAVELGIANSVVPLEELEKAANDLADELKDKPYAIVYAKKMIHEASEARMADLFDKEMVTALTSASKGQRNIKAGKKMEK